MSLKPDASVLPSSRELGAHAPTPSKASGSSVTIASSEPVAPVSIGDGWDRHPLRVAAVELPRLAGRPDLVDLLEGYRALTSKAGSLDGAGTAQRLEEVIRYAKRSFEIGLSGIEATSEQKRALRAYSLSMAEDAAERAHALKLKGLTERILYDLDRLIAKEPDATLKRFAAHRAVIFAAEAKLSLPAAMKELVLPESPPYAEWFKDGQLQVSYSIDDDGTTATTERAYFTERLGFTEQRLDERTFVYSKTADDGTPIRVRMTVGTSGADAHTKAFDAISRREADLVVYSGHAGHGTYAAESLKSAVKAPGAGQAGILLECWGSDNLPELHRFFPGAQFLGPTDKTTVGSDHDRFEALLEAFLERKSWSEIDDVLPGPGLFAWLFDEGPLNVPNDPEVLERERDLDDDGLKEATVHSYEGPPPVPPDRTFDVAYPANPATAIQPLRQVATNDFHENAASQVLGHLRAALDGASQTLQPLPAFSLGALEPGKAFVPAGGDPRAYRFIFNRETNKVVVQPSTAFGHASHRARANLLALELGFAVGQNSRLPFAQRSALGLTLYARARTPMASPPHAQWLEDVMVAQRYGLESFPPLPKGLSETQSIVDGNKDLAELSLQAPRPLPELRLPKGLTLAGSPTSRGTAERLLHALGLTGRVVAFYPHFGDDARTFAAVVADAGGQRSWLTVSSNEQHEVTQVTRGVVPARSVIRNEAARLLQVLEEEKGVDTSAARRRLGSEALDESAILALVLPIADAAFSSPPVKDARALRATASTLVELIGCLSTDERARSAAQRLVELFPGFDRMRVQESLASWVGSPGQLAYDDFDDRDARREAVEKRIEQRIAKGLSRAESLIEELAPAGRTAPFDPKGWFLAFEYSIAGADDQLLAGLVAKLGSPPRELFTLSTVRHLTGCSWSEASPDAITNVVRGDFSAGMRSFIEAAQKSESEVDWMLFERSLRAFKSARLLDDSQLRELVTLIRRG
jgi:hypothetical protein